VPDTIKFPDDHYVIDVGMHDGADSLYYARRGFKVIAFEANPMLAQEGQDKFAGLGLDITVRNLAISDQAGQKVKFYVNNERSQWSSLKPDLGTRDGGATEIEVSSCSLTDELAPLGDRIHMVKIDIEGYDYVALQQLALLPHKPTYVSVENGGIYFVNLMSEMGYDKFKFANQKYNTSQRIPPHSKHGRPTDQTFLPHSSGPFGEDLPGRWLTKSEALQVGQALELARQAAPNNLFADAVGWFDMHAAL
jgi:FkbM family methyltransferase